MSQEQITQTCSICAQYYYVRLSFVSIRTIMPNIPVFISHYYLVSGFRSTSTESIHRICQRKMLSFLIFWRPTPLEPSHSLYRSTYTVPINIHPISISTFNRALLCSVPCSAGSDELCPDWPRSGPSHSSHKSRAKQTRGPAKIWAFDVMDRIIIGFFPLSRVVQAQPL
ncbi:hypothetical protein EDB82DRAFT_312954 [Fusarium venenatum]|uniref:uncharacterized protein n=1 Tax=Fusarium venenatum TaxID=56646 RepID=UPI001D75EAC9|nr:hypothetical protein EDB82DRAFT_312954 [Fusarium venenatum]